MSASTHTPLVEICRQLQTDGQELVKQYLDYKEHVCRQVYADLDGWQQRRSGREEAWQEYEKSMELISRPEYLIRHIPETQHAQPSAASSLIHEGQTWAKLYLNEHVQMLQEHRQHHVHVYNSKGERVPQASSPEAHGSATPAWCFVKVCYMQ